LRVDAGLLAVLIAIPLWLRPVCAIRLTQGHFVAQSECTMKRGPALFLQVVIMLIGIGALAFLLWEPHVEGRNAHATTFEIYFKDPFLAYAYVGSIPFFVALYRAFGLFRRAGRDGAFSQVSVDTLRAINRCALATMGFVAGGVVIILLTGDKEDRPAGIFMSLLVTLLVGGIATAAAMFARKLQNSLRQSEGSRA
jgi:Protein of unknown function (DUF2975)